MATDAHRAELLYGRGEQLRVFVSSEMRSGKLARAREVVAAAVDEHPDFAPWLWERSANAGRYSAYDVCVETARTSDVLILILGTDLTEVTRAEWEAARGAGANCALLIKEGVTRTPAAEAFIKAERVGTIDKDFHTLGQLRQAVQSVLRREVISAARQRQLTRAERRFERGAGTAQLLEIGIARTMELVENGQVPNAAALLAELEVQVSSLDRTSGLDLAAGRVRGAEGDVVAATAAYRRVIASPVAEAIDVAISRQNLGLELMRAGHTKAAGREMKAGFRLHAKIGNWFGALQVTINLANLAVQIGRLDGAESLADIADEFRRTFDEPLPHQHASLLAIKALIAARRGAHREALAGYRATLVVARRSGDREFSRCIRPGRSVRRRRWLAVAETPTTRFHESCTQPSASRRSRETWRTERPCLMSSDVQPSRWPFFDLCIRTPRVELRYATDDLLLALLEPHNEGVFPPGAEPFDGESSFYETSPERETKFLTGEWGARSKLSVDWWHLSFAVLYDGEPVGMQDITASEFPRVRTVNSFSWLATRHQGAGLGKEMRTAVLHLAFHGLGALRAESDAFDDNTASRGVSLSLGYEPNGTMISPRPSGGFLMNRFLLTRERWQASPAAERTDIHIDGLERCLPLLGLSENLRGPDVTARL